MVGQFSLEVNRKDEPAVRRMPRLRSSKPAEMRASYSGTDTDVLGTNELKQGLERISPLYSRSVHPSSDQWVVDSSRTVARSENGLRQKSDPRLVRRTWHRPMPLVRIGKVGCDRGGPEPRFNYSPFRKAMS
jgi:hypothetical protein